MAAGVVATGVGAMGVAATEVVVEALAVRVGLEDEVVVGEVLGEVFGVRVLEEVEVVVDGFVLGDVFGLLVEDVVLSTRAEAGAS